MLKKIKNPNPRDSKHIFSLKTKIVSPDTQKNRHLLGANNALKNVVRLQCQTGWQQFK